MKKELTHERLLELLSYNPETGIFIWLGKAHPHTSDRFIGAVAGHTKKTGYIQISIQGDSYKAARLAWFYMHGAWPVFADHKDGNPNNNKLSNIRDVDPAGNSQNQRKASRGSSTGLLGVQYEKERNCYRADITIKRKKLYIGRYKTAQDAHEAYLKAKRELHSTCTI